MLHERGGDCPVSLLPRRVHISSALCALTFCRSGPNATNRGSSRGGGARALGAVASAGGNVPGGLWKPGSRLENLVGYAIEMAQVRTFGVGPWRFPDKSENVQISEHAQAGCFRGAACFQGAGQGAGMGQSAPSICCRPAHACPVGDGNVPHLAFIGGSWRLRQSPDIDSRRDRTVASE